MRDTTNSLKDYLRNNSVPSPTTITRIAVYLESLLINALKPKYNEQTLVQVLQCYYFLLRKHSSMCLVKMLQSNDFSMLYDLVYQYSGSLLLNFDSNSLYYLITKHKNDILTHLVATLTDLVHNRNTYISTISICLLSWIGSALEREIAILWAPGVFSCFGKILYRDFKMNSSTKILFIECFSLWIDKCFSCESITKLTDIDFYRKRIFPMIRALSNFIISTNDNLSRLILGHKMMDWIEFTFFSNDRQTTSLLVFSILILLFDGVDSISKQCINQKTRILSEPLHEFVTEELLLSCVSLCIETHDASFIRYFQVILASCIWTSNIGKSFFHDHFSELLGILKDRISIPLGNYNTKSNTSCLLDTSGTSTLLDTFAYCTRQIMDESIIKIVESMKPFDNNLMFYIGTLCLSDTGSDRDNKRLMLWHLAQETLDVSTVLYSRNLDHTLEDMAALWMHRISLLHRHHSEIFSTVLVKVLPTVLALYSCGTLVIQDEAYLLLNRIKSEKTIPSFLFEHHTYLLHDIQMSFYTESNIEQAGLVLCSLVKLLKGRDHSLMIHRIFGNVFLNKILDTLESHCNRRGNKRIVLLLLYTITECIKELETSKNITECTNYNSDILDQLLEYVNGKEPYPCANVKEDNNSLPDPYTWIFRMMKSVSYFLMDDNVCTRWVALRVLTLSFECIGKTFALNVYREHLFPLVHSLWSMFAQVFRHSYEISNTSSSHVMFYSSMELLQQICKCCGNFIQSRISDIYNCLTSYLQKQKIENMPLDFAVIMTRVNISEMEQSLSHDALGSISDQVILCVDIILEHVMKESPWPKKLWKILAGSQYNGELFEKLIKTIIRIWPNEVLCDLMYHYSNVHIEPSLHLHHNSTSQLSEKFCLSLKKILYGKENPDGIVLYNSMEMLM